MLDTASLVLVALAVLVCVVLALVGFSLAEWTLPFFVGALIGDGLVVFANKLPRFRKPLVILALLLVAAGLITHSVLSFNPLAYRVLELQAWVSYEVLAIVRSFTLGLVVGFGGLVLSSVVLPGPGSPETWEEAIGQRRGLVRGTFVTVGLLLAFLALAVLVFGALAFIAYVVAAFSG